MAEIAIIKTGGKQYKVEVGDTLKVEKIEATDKKLELVDLLNGKKVTVAIIGEGKRDKIEITKFRAKKRYERHQGHRQLFTEIKIESIG